MTFSVTHDVPNNDGFRGMIFDPQDEYLANAYVLGRDGGVPMIYSDHGESAANHPTDKARWHTLWKRADIQGMLAFHNAMHGQPERSLHTSPVALVLARGDQGVLAINKSGDWQHTLLSSHGLQAGDYECALHGHRMHVAGCDIDLHVPPRQAQMWRRVS